MQAMLPGTERHPHARAVLGPALPPDGSASHAYLFPRPAGAGNRDVGPASLARGRAGAGRGAVAGASAAALRADGAADPESAAARVRSGAHPDLTWVAPTGAAQMLVSDIDEPVVGAATRTPFESARRV